MSLDDNKAIIRSYVETVWNQRQLDRAEEFVAPDLVDHAPFPGQAPGLDGARRKWAMYLNAAPDLRVTIEDLVAEDDKVGVRRSYAGTHRGELLGIPATGKQVRVGSISIFRLAGGKIAEIWEQLELLSLMQQLGVLPAPPRPRPRREGRRRPAAVTTCLVAELKRCGSSGLVCSGGEGTELDR